MKKVFAIMLVIILTGCGEVKERSSTVKNIDEVLKQSEEIEQYLMEKDDQNNGTNNVVLTLFYSSTCPHCHAEIEWLDSIKDEYKYLKIVEYEASENMDFYEEVVEKMQINDYHVPLTIIGNDYQIGYASYENEEFIELINKYSQFESCDMVETIKNNGDISKCREQNQH